MKNFEIYKPVLKNTGFDSAAEDSYIPYCESFLPLSEAVNVGSFRVGNRVCYQPMEGQDGVNGAPTDITFERYKRLAEGGAGIIWFEAVAVCREGMSNPGQLMITDENSDSFAALASMIKRVCREKYGFDPLLIMQLNHSGAHSKPGGVPAPVGFDAGSLASLAEKFVKSAILAANAGFTGIDVKCCHHYLLSELYSRGETFPLLEIARRISLALPDGVVRACRINAYDGYSEGGANVKYADVVISELESIGYNFFNITMGSPYINPDVSRPYRAGLCKPKENPLDSLSRLLGGCRDIKKLRPRSYFVCTGLSVLGEYSPYAAAGCVEEGFCDFAGFGRMSLAYPELASDVLSGRFDGKKSCVACCGCSELKRKLLQSGCIIRNPYYKEIYKKWKAQS